MMKKLYFCVRSIVGFVLVLLLVMPPVFAQQPKAKQISNIPVKENKLKSPPSKKLEKVDAPTAYRIWFDWYDAQHQGSPNPTPTLKLLNVEEKEAARLNAIWNKARLDAQRDVRRKFEQQNNLKPQNQNQPRNLTIDPVKNRITSPGYEYDLAGNLIAEPGATYAYDAENRLTTATVNGVVTKYFYDPLGRRVKKVVDEVTTRFIYDHNGRLIAEYTGDPAPSTPSKEYIYGSNGLLAVVEPNNPNPDQVIKYVTQDHLATPRITTDIQGNVVSRNDYFPFGESISASLGNRMSVLGYANENSIRQKFTSHERDDETGLDFAQARYYSSNQTRFLSLDPLGQSEDLQNPQTWNRYSYVLNNPLRYSDPDGQRPQEGADIRQRQDIKDLQQGKITSQEYWSRQNARAAGAAIGVGLVGTGFFGVRALPSILAFLGRNPQLVQETADMAVQTSTGNPLATSYRGVPMAGPATSVLTTTFNKSAGEIFSGGFNVGIFGKSSIDAAVTQAGNTLYGALGYIEKLPPFSKGLSKVSDLEGFIDALKAVAKERGLTKLEFSVLAPNAKLEKQLIKQGYTKSSVTVGGETYSGYTKVIDTK